MRQFQTDEFIDPNDPMYARWKNKPHPETPNYSLDRLLPEPVKGKAFERLPLRLMLEANTTYKFCTCGYSKQQVSPTYSASLPPPPLFPLIPVNSKVWMIHFHTLRHIWFMMLALFLYRPMWVMWYPSPTYVFAYNVISTSSGLIWDLNLWTPRWYVILL